MNANNQSHSTLILSCFCVIVPMFGISCRYQDLSQLSYSTLSNPQILSISVMSLSRLGFLKASGVFLWLFCIDFFIMQVFMLSAFLQVTVRTPLTVFWVSDFLSNCLLVMCLVLSLHLYLWNLISTKFGKSIEIAKMLSSCKFCVNE